MEMTKDLVAKLAVEVEDAMGIKIIGIKFNPGGVVEDVDEFTGESFMDEMMPEITFTFNTQSFTDEEDDKASALSWKILKEYETIAILTPTNYL